MSVLEGLNLDRPRVASLWEALDLDTRTMAARAVYESEDRANRLEADTAIAERMRFRLASVRKLPIDKRVGYLAGTVHPDESVASTLILAFHLEHRRDLLSAFLDSLEVPNRNGIIDENHDMQPPSATALEQATDNLFEKFPEPDVELYLASLLTMDSANWSGLSEILRGRM